jgi:predicted kinase
MNIRIPHNALVILVGPSGSGKSTFARQFFPKESIVSSDRCRRLLKHGDLDFVCSEDSIQDVSEGAFVMFHNWIRAQLRHNKLTVADATSVNSTAREQLEQIAKEEHTPVVYLVFNRKQAECVLKDSERPFPVGEAVINRQYKQFSRSFRYLKNVGAVVLDSADLSNLPLINLVYTQLDLEIKHSAVDVISDVHGCYDEFIELIEKLGYTLGSDGLYTHPQGRVLVSVGDIVDRGPKVLELLEFFRKHVEAGNAYLVKGNHEQRLAKKLSGRDVKLTNGLQATLNQIPAGYNKAALKQFLYSCTKPYLVFTMPNSSPVVITHAAFKGEFLGKIDRNIEDYCMYGPTDGVTEEGFPNRIEWWNDYEGPTVVYGHNVVEGSRARVTKNTYGIDTGCCFGGALTALRLPELKLVSVPAHATYYAHSVPQQEKTEPALVGFVSELLKTRALTIENPSGQFELRISGKEALEKAVEAVSMRTIPPDRLVWLAPTMSVGPVSPLEGYMEDPVTTATWMLDNVDSNVNSLDPSGIELIAEVKHMGSRGVWGCWKVDGRWEVICWTKRGYYHFDEPLRSQITDEMQLYLSRIEEDLGKTNFILFDSEVKPWNLKGAGLVENEFWLTGACGLSSRLAMLEAYTTASERKVENFDPKIFELQNSVQNLHSFQEIVDGFCWPVSSIDDVDVGFFDILAYGDQKFIASHETTVTYLNSVFSRCCFASPTIFRCINALKLDDLMEWWKELTEKQPEVNYLGYKKRFEGIVLKYNSKELKSKGPYAQQQLKVRGQSYLNIIYGPQYQEPAILAKLKHNRSNRSKLRAAWQQDTLSSEALRLYLEGKPWEEWHRLIVCSLASEFVHLDPRL